ncbi:SIR2 family protein [Erwinia billingiae]|uniref:SIR2 family protein n=1 Tax=Erwinia billingiae TaxID=182337 RepID=UPI00320B860F
MNLTEFMGSYVNHPVVFVGAGFSRRYLIGTFSWPELLKKIVYEMKGSHDFYFDSAGRHANSLGEVDLPKVASEIEMEFNRLLEADRNGKFKRINDKYYTYAAAGNYSASRLKIFISELVDLHQINEDDKYSTEMELFAKASRNIGSIITTNYDRFIETLIGFNPIIGNDILLSNPYGSVYKIHGCVSQPESIVISDADYDRFRVSNHLIRAQLISLFIHNPIIFIGYSISDENIRDILKTIFSFISKDSTLADKVRKNFLLIEREADSNSLEVLEHDVVIENIGNIKINKIKTDNFQGVFEELLNLKLPVSSMDIRKVEGVMRKIKEGGTVKVKIVGDLESLTNDELVMAVGSIQKITYHYQSASEMVMNYFEIMDSKNDALIMLLNKIKVTRNQYFTAHGFSTICDEIQSIEQLKANQVTNLSSYFNTIDDSERIECDTVDEIISLGFKSYKTVRIIFYNIYVDNIDLNDFEGYLREGIALEMVPSDYKRLVSLYDFKRHH